MTANRQESNAYQRVQPSRREFTHLFRACLKALTNLLKVNNTVITIQWHLSPFSSNWQLVNQSADWQQLKRGGTLHPLTCIRQGLRESRAKFNTGQRLRHNWEQETVWETVLSYTDYSYKLFLFLSGAAIFIWYKYECSKVCQVWVCGVPSGEDQSYWSGKFYDVSQRTYKLKW